MGEHRGAASKEDFLEEEDARAEARSLLGGIGTRFTVWKEKTGGTLSREEMTSRCEVRNDRP